MTQPLDQPTAQLAARLLYLTRQEKELEKEKTSIKERLEALYSSNKIAAKPGDIESLFSDGSTRKIRLMRVPQGMYFKVADDHKNEYKAELEKLNTKYLKSGKASIEEKAHNWQAKEVKG